MLLAEFGTSRKHGLNLELRLDQRLQMHFALSFWSSSFYFRMNNRRRLTYSEILFIVTLEGLLSGGLQGIHAVIDEHGSTMLKAS